MAHLEDLFRIPVYLSSSLQAQDALGREVLSIETTSRQDPLSFELSLWEFLEEVMPRNPIRATEGPPQHHEIAPKLKAVPTPHEEDELGVAARNLAMDIDAIISSKEEQMNPEVGINAFHESSMDLDAPPVERAEAEAGQGGSNGMVIVGSDMEEEEIVLEYNDDSDSSESGDEVMPVPRRTKCGRWSESPGEWWTK